MKIVRFQVFLATGAMLAAIAMMSTADALDFTVDETLSSISLSGTVTLPTGAMLPFSAQALGSDTASYSGSISVSVDDLLAPTSIELTGASLLASIYPDPLLPATDGGPAAGDPGMPALANYGIELDLGGLGKAYAAMRGLEWDLVSGVEPVAGGTFSSASQLLTSTTGSFDINAPPIFGLDPVSDPVADLLGSLANVAGLSSYSVSGTTATLTVPFAATVNVDNSDDLQMTFDGTLVATATVPEPSTIAIAGLLIGLAGLCGIRRRS